MPRKLSSTFYLTAICAAVFIFVPSAQAAKRDWGDLEKKAQQYIGNSSQGGSSQGNSNGNSSVNLSIPGQPTGRVLDTSAKMLSEKDTWHVTVHMKLANRGFLAKKYDKAINELELVFDRQPDHCGGRFMRAVIAARKRDHMTAWQNILIAQKKEPENEKIKSFIEKLSTVMPQPEKFVGVPGIYRPTPISACEKATDAMERFLKDPTSSDLVNFSTGDYVKAGSDTTMELKMAFSSSPNVEQILALFKQSTGKTAERIDDKSSPKKLAIKFNLAELPIQNPKVKPASGLRDFVKTISDQADVALSDTVEEDKENKILETTYDIAARSFSSLNDFLRKAAPYAHTFRVIELKLAYIKGSQEIIWKGKVKVAFQLQ